mgnify:CR=1 FL=1
MLSKLRSFLLNLLNETPACIIQGVAITARLSQFKIAGLFAVMWHLGYLQELFIRLGGFIARLQLLQLFSGS